MFEVLIFGGTTEGRQLAQFCVEHKIKCTVSVTTDYGASLLPGGVEVLAGRLECCQMTRLIKDGKYGIIDDATHPYAEEATANIRAACGEAEVPYYRILRRASELRGIAADDLDELVMILDRCNCTVLSTLGSKAVEKLAKVRGHRERIWLRVLPDQAIQEKCIELGFDKDKIIAEKGPFSIEQNVTHLKKSSAKLLVTKDSGGVGGYPEKAEAARRCGAEMITIRRPEDSGYTLEEFERLLLKWGEGL